jgi:hypothetical protein
MTNRIMPVAIAPSNMDDDRSPSNDDDDIPLGTFLSQAFDDVDIEVDSVEDVREIREDV